MTPRPVAPRVNAAAIPEALRAERRWVMWRYVWQQHEGKTGRWTKQPFQPSGHAAKSDDSSTWTGFAEALTAYASGRFDGIGFVLGDGWAGIDVDHSVGHTWPLLEDLACYYDQSPSQEGFKIFGRSARIGGQIDFAQGESPTFTPWARPRFFTITGRHASGDPRADLTTFIDNWFPAPVALSSTHEGYADAADMDDEMLWAQMLGGADEQSDRRLALFQGDTSAYGGDHSRADFALVAHLA
jgi:putative DNA primase/helicase